jgi:hypothetical protein
MKAKLIVVLGCLLISSYSFASCGSCQQNANPCGESIDTCQCADPNYDANPCMSVSQYCDAFGNIGGLNR